MRKSELKLKLHNLVDQINDEMILLNFYDAFSSLTSEKKNNYELSEEQNTRLSESLVQYKNGNVVDDNEVRKQIASWLEK